MRDPQQIMTIIICNSFVRRLCTSMGRPMTSYPRFSFRVFSSFDKGKSDPFAILGVPPSSSYDHVKQAFVRLALEKHPDRVGSSNSNNASTTKSLTPTEEFVQIRQAFEAIHQLRRGTKDDENENDDDYWPDGDEWWMYDDEDGIVSNLFTSLKMSHDTRQEVINVYKTMAPGGKDKGGYWDMARQMAERQEARRAAGRGGDGDDDDNDEGPILRLEASPPTSISRRRRKR